MRVRTTMVFDDVTVLGELRRIVDETRQMDASMSVMIESTPNGAQIIVTDPKDPTPGIIGNPSVAGGWHPSSHHPANARGDGPPVVVE